MNNYRFDDKLEKYNTFLLNFFEDVSGSKRTNPKVTILTYNLLMHGPVTQPHLKELTGFSVGTISNYLSLLQKYGYLKKSETQPIYYSFNGSLKDLFERGMGIFEISAQAATQFLPLKLKEMEALAQEGNEGAVHLIKRLSEIITVFEIYSEFLPIFYGFEKKSIK